MSARRRTTRSRVEPASSRVQRSSAAQRRRSPQPVEAPAIPTGWRSTRRSSGARKQAERDVRKHQLRERFAGAAADMRSGLRAAVFLGGRVLVAAAVSIAGLWLVANAINHAARWNAERVAAIEASPEAQQERAKLNLLLIAVTEGRATGFLAMRALPDQNQVFGIAIPDGTFVEIPGQGFDRIGESYAAGPESAMATVTNFFGVQFTSYVVVDSAVYQEVLSTQDVSTLLDEVVETNLAEADARAWRERFAEISVENTALVPMPVKPISVGNQTYFEPQRAEIVDLVASWWGVTLDAADAATRVIVYNGTGAPGIAGQVAQLLIRGGFRVVDTKNADRFDYAVTQVVIQGGDREAADSVVELLGVGEIVEQPADQEIADVIIIIGADYEVPEPAQ